MPLRPHLEMGSSGTLATNYVVSIQELRDVFDHPDQGRSGVQKLLHLRQGNASIAEHSIEFCILANDSSWNEPALLARFHEGRHPDIQLEPSCKDTDLILSSCISLAIKLDQHLSGKGLLTHANQLGRWQGSRRTSPPDLPSQRPSPSEIPAPELMDASTSRVPVHERERWLANGPSQP